jgi:NAD(P)-dependent dehydrogenase (short-subunit alcohol dehydrogenase family)
MSRVVLVVGASSGIGRAVARQLSAAGDQVILSSRGKAALEKAAEQCPGADVRPLDVRDRHAVEDTIAGIVSDYGHLDAVIHTAGVVAYGRFETIPGDVFDAVMQTNVLGMANVARAVLPVMRRQTHGSLVLFGSVLGDIAAPMMTPYIVSKYAVRSLGRQLAIENRDLPDVRITVVSPGGVDTPIYKLAANYQGRPGRPPAPVDSADRVARAAVRALDRPRDRISVGKLNPLMRLGFSLMPPVFDAIVTPLFNVLASKPGEERPTTGNTLEPLDELEAEDGGFGQGLRDVAGRLAGR